MKTTFLAKEKVQRRWFVADAAGLTLGRLACRVALVLRGKDQANFTPFTDSGAYVIVVNAAKVVLSGRKNRQKTYKRYSGYPGGLHVTAARDMRPVEIVKHAIRGMLPGNRLRAKQLTRLKIFENEEHTYHNQKPEILNI